ncbi:hypothetical protein CXG81DRAFT_24681 [Caulochytrium protostelioides]|uniref:BTB domain-containing protein n=1 Tax=Caulochytrium protostelioides TaxID=1555241 RepID=A0A4P9XB60_9FUNG|nr:hypothetical protein CXG81DRAFT_24681 [Caulochytrium protostelioides]|eukprot:RKP02628.1 hypothetical protein CXG81DRAFT_24681 [Caulochytrium protostelioides]
MATKMTSLPSAGRAGDLGWKTSSYHDLIPINRELAAPLLHEIRSAQARYEAAHDDADHPAQQEASPVSTASSSPRSGHSHAKSGRARPQRLADRVTDRIPAADSPALLAFYRRITQNLAQYGWKKGLFSDVTVVAMGHPFQLHRLILLQSPYFAGLFAGIHPAAEEPSPPDVHGRRASATPSMAPVDPTAPLWADTHHPTIHLHFDEDSPITLFTIEIVLARLYGRFRVPTEAESETPVLTPETAPALLVTAQYFGDTELAQICLAFVCNTITHGTIGFYCAWFEEYDVGADVHAVVGDALLVHLSRRLAVDTPLQKAITQPREHGGVHWGLIERVLYADCLCVRNEAERVRLVLRLAHRYLQSHLAAPPRGLASRDALRARLTRVERVHAQVQRTLTLVPVYAHLPLADLTALRQAAQQAQTCLGQLKQELHTRAATRRDINYLSLPALPEIEAAMAQQHALRFAVETSAPDSRSMSLTMPGSAASSPCDGSDLGPRAASGSSHTSSTSSSSSAAVSPLLDASSDIDDPFRSDDRRTYFVHQPRVCSPQSTKHGAKTAVPVDDTDRITVQSLNDLILKRGGLPRSLHGATSVNACLADVKAMPFRFAVKFKRGLARQLRAGDRVASHRVFYAGSIWQIYLQMVLAPSELSSNTAVLPKLGIYLQRFAPEQIGYRVSSHTAAAAGDPDAEGEEGGLSAGSAGSAEMASALRLAAAGLGSDETLDVAAASLYPSEAGPLARPIRLSPPTLRTPFSQTAHAPPAAESVSAALAPASASTSASASAPLSASLARHGDHAMDSDSNDSDITLPRSSARRIPASTAPPRRVRAHGARSTPPRSVSRSRSPGSPPSARAAAHQPDRHAADGADDDTHADDATHADDEAHHAEDDADDVFDEDIFGDESSDDDAAAAEDASDALRRRWQAARRAMRHRGRGAAPSPAPKPPSVHATLTQPQPALPYSDPREATLTWFTLYCYFGTKLFRLASKPDTFRHSQSWGWRSAKLWNFVACLENGGTSLLDWDHSALPSAALDGAEMSDDHETTLEICVAMGHS